LFVRVIREGQLLCDVSATQEIYELVKSARPSHPLVSEVDFNVEHCFLGVNSLDVDKSTGVRALLERWARPPTVFMIGDSIADYMNLTEVRHLAVGNAKPEYKKIAERIAQRNFAQGCVELLAAL
jgi:hydroxymethylpyrimidine pyrophosphatase-like HAD family hydrolase